MQKKILTIVSATVVTLAVCALVLILYKDYKAEHTPSQNETDLAAYYGIEGNEVFMIIDEKVSEKKAWAYNDTIYLDPQTVKQLYSNRFFYVPQENSIFYTTPSEEYRFVPGSCEAFVNEAPYHTEKPVIEVRGGEPYVSVDFLQNCGIRYTVAHDPEILMITYSDDPYLCTFTKEASEIRVSGNIKADILKRVGPGEELRIIESGGVRENGFIKVMSKDGVRGYIPESVLSSAEYETPAESTFKSEEYFHLRHTKKVYLGWHLVYTRDMTDELKKIIAGAPEMTVISPTWFFLDSSDGHFRSYADKEYIRIAHEAGLQVWAALKNDPIENVFSCKEDTHLLLSSTVNRRSLINNLISSCREYDIDGINIDLESLNVETGVYFIQFLRELSIACREKGIVLSVDNYVPESYNAFYDIKEQAEILDYVIIMGYDEHYAGCGTAGSVSSLGWFKRAIENALKKADRESLIMGVPFYTRLWKEKDGGVYVDAVLGMDAAEKTVAAQNAIKYWQKDPAQYYSEYAKDGAIYKIWLEDHTSLSYKVEAIRENELAGIAAWMLGDETEGTWAVLKECFEGTPKKD